MTIMKEYYEKTVDMKTPQNPNAKPIVTGNVCIIRFEDNRKLRVKDVAVLFNEAAKDFPAHIQATAIGVKSDHIEVELGTPLPGYKKLLPKTIGARG